MGLFGNYASLEKPAKAKKTTLVSMAEEQFAGQTDLLNEIKLYLRSRREQHCYPSKVSWKMQLDLLEKVPEQKRASQVHTCTLKGYRAIAFEDNNVCRPRMYEQGVTSIAAKRAKAEKLNIVNKGF